MAVDTTVRGRRVWKEYSKDNADKLNTMYRSMFLSQEQKRSMMKALGSSGIVPEGGNRPRILDLGCGTGEIAVTLHDSGYDVTGIDVSPAMLAHFRRNIGDRPIALVEADFFDWTPDGPLFDAVTARWVFPFYPDFRRPLEVVARFIRPGGVIVYESGSREAVANVARVYGLDEDELAGKTFEPNQPAQMGNEIAAFCEENGLRLEQRYPSTFWHQNPLLLAAFGDRDRYKRELDQHTSKPDVQRFIRWFEDEISSKLGSLIGGSVINVIRKLEVSDDGRAPTAPQQVLSSQSSVAGPSETAGSGHSPEDDPPHSTQPQTDREARLGDDISQRGSSRGSYEPITVDVDRFRRDGYLIFREALDGDRISAYRRKLDAGLTPGGDLLSHPDYAELLTDPVVTGIARALLGAKPTYFGCSSISRATTAGMAFWHRDNADRLDMNGPDWTGGTYTPIRFGIYMQDHRDHSGGMLVRPGTHRPESSGLESLTYLDTVPGDLVVWDMRLTYAVGGRRLRADPERAIDIPEARNAAPETLLPEPEGAHYVAFLTYGLSGNEHTERFIDYLATRKYQVDLWKRSKVCDHAKILLWDADLRFRDIWKEIKDKPGIGAHVNHRERAHLTDKTK